MKITDFLAPADVMIDVAISDKQKLLLELASKAGTTLDVAPEQVLAELLKREKLGSTGMGNGIAIPHARFHQIGKPFGMLARLRKPVDFDAVDEQPVDLVFLLLLPAAADGEQLGVLASVARKLRNSQITARLRDARDSSGMYRVLTEA